MAGRRGTLARAQKQQQDDGTPKAGAGAEQNGRNGVEAEKDTSAEQEGAQHVADGASSKKEGAQTGTSAEQEGAQVVADGASAEQEGAQTGAGAEKKGADHVADGAGVEEGAVAEKEEESGVHAADASDERKGR